MGARLSTSLELQQQSSRLDSELPAPPRRLRAEYGGVLLVAAVISAAVHLAASLTVALTPAELDLEALTHLYRHDPSPAVETTPMRVFAEPEEPEAEEPEPPPEPLAVAPEPEAAPEPEPEAVPEPEPEPEVQRTRRARAQRPEPAPAPAPTETAAAAPEPEAPEPEPEPTGRPLTVPGDASDAPPAPPPTKTAMAAPAPTAPGATGPGLGARGGEPDGQGTAQAPRGGTADKTERGPGGDGIDLEGARRAWLTDVNDALHKSYPYPTAARRRGLEGRVKLKIWVDEHGRIAKVAVHKSSGHDVLDQAAIEAVVALGRVPTPPPAIGWTKSAMIVPFDYRLRS